MNRSSFVGNDKSDAVRHNRYLHCLLSQFALIPKVKFTIGFDIGAEQKFKGSENYKTWIVGAVIVQFWLSTGLTSHLEHNSFEDETDGIVASETSKGFDTRGFSINADYKITPKVMWKTEIKNYTNQDDMFIRNNGSMTNNNFSVATALAIEF